MRVRTSTRPATTLLVAAAVALAVSTSGSARTAVAPANTTEPTISGASLVGQTLTASRGTWTGTAPITYAFAWQRCDANGKNCTPITNATGQTYTPVSSDIGRQLRVAVTATNTNGDVTATSDPTAAIATASGKPASSSPPVISGDATVGSTLSTTTGAWAGDQPITYSYQWQRCDSSGNACANEASGGTKSTYQVVKNDAGQTIRVQVTGTNARGSSKAISTATDVVKSSSNPSDIIDLGGGAKSAPVESVTPGERLIVKTVAFSPNPVTSRNQTITAKVTVTDTRGYYIRGAWVFIRSTPILTEAVEDQMTSTNGTVTFYIHPRSDFPIKNGYSVQFFVKAYMKGEPTLAGVSGTRLVQVGTSTG